MNDLSLASQASAAFSNAQNQKLLNLADQAQGQKDSPFAKMLEKQNAEPRQNIDPTMRRKIRETAEEFEAQFLGQMLRPMFEGVQLEEPFGGGQAEKMWQSLLVDEYGKAIVKNGGIGLADQVQRELLRTQEGLR